MMYEKTVLVAMCLLASAAVISTVYSLFSHAVSGDTDKQ